MPNDVFREAEEQREVRDCAALLEEETAALRVRVAELEETVRIGQQEKDEMTVKMQRLENTLHEIKGAVRSLSSLVQPSL